MCALGPAVGLNLYQVGGFMLPFELVGALGVIFGIAFNLAIVGLYKEKDDSIPTGQESTRVMAQVGWKATNGFFLMGYLQARSASSSSTLRISTPSMPPSSDHYESIQEEEEERLGARPARMVCQPSIW